MQEVDFLHYVVQNIVEHPESIEIEKKVDEL